MRTTITVALLAVFVPMSAAAQSFLNPDLSVIGDMRYAYRNTAYQNLENAAATAFTFEELEVGINGYLNPYARADFFIAMHGITGPVELEEGYASIVRGIPVTLRAGKYFVDFGKLNAEHLHLYSWIQFPQWILNNFNGEENGSALGFQVKRLQGVGDTALTLSINGFSSAVMFDRETQEAPEESKHGAEEPTRVGWSGRLSMFRELTQFQWMEIGVSGMWGVPNVERGLEARLANIDATYKWQPSVYKGVKWRAEGVWTRRDVGVLLPDSSETVERVDSYGAFSSLEIRFRQRWDFGGYYDYAQNVFIDDIDSKAFGLWFGFNMVEETIRMSVVWRNESGYFIDGDANKITLQVLWSLGPHKPHIF